MENLTDEQLLELAEKDAQKLLGSDNKEEQPAPEPTPEDPKDPEKEEEQPGDEGKGKSNIAKLLEQRNQARSESKAKDDVIGKKDEEISTLQQQLNELKAKQLGEDDDPREHDLAIVEKTTELTSAKREKKFLQENQDTKFFEENPEALEIVDELDSIKAKHPTLSTKDAYNLLLSKLGIQPGAKPKPKESYDLLGTTTRGTNSSKEFEDMTTAEQEAYLIAEEQKGTL